jgi:hypothetical protein
MLTRLKNWIEGSRRRAGEQSDADRGQLSERERQRIAAGNLDTENEPHWRSEAFDETRRGRPGA